MRAKAPSDHSRRFSRDSNNLLRFCKIRSSECPESPYAGGFRVRMLRRPYPRHTRMNTGEEQGLRFAESPLRALRVLAPDPHGDWLKPSFGAQKTQNLMDCFFWERS